MTNTRSLWDAAAGDGRPFLIFTGLILLLTGLLVIVQSLTGHFLPHDVAFLGMDACQLTEMQNGTIAQFMFHDRISFGGSILAVGLLYMWMAEFPLKQQEPWAWYLFLFSGVIGFASFLSYLGYGYLDTWHGMATLLLLPFFVIGMIRSYPLVRGAKWKSVFSKRNDFSLRSAHGVGIALLLFSSVGMITAGITISIVGMTSVFVPQDLEFMNITVCGIDQLNPRLKPLIAHDRAAFGSGLAVIGLLFFFILRCAEHNISLWQIMALALSVGFLTALGVHYWVGYTNFIHLLPAYFGACTSALGLVLTYKEMTQPHTYVLS